METPIPYSHHDFTSIKELHPFRFFSLHVQYNTTKTAAGTEGHDLFIIILVV